MLVYPLRDKGQHCICWHKCCTACSFWPPTESYSSNSWHLTTVPLVPPLVVYRTNHLWGIQGDNGTRFLWGTLQCTGDTGASWDIKSKLAGIKLYEMTTYMSVVSDLNTCAQSIENKLFYQSWLKAAVLITRWMRKLRLIMSQKWMFVLFKKKCLFDQHCRDKRLLF